MKCTLWCFPAWSSAKLVPFLPAHCNDASIQEGHRKPPQNHPDVRATEQSILSISIHDSMWKDYFKYAILTGYSRPLIPRLSPIHATDLILVAPICAGRTVMLPHILLPLGTAADVIEPLETTSISNFQALNNWVVDYLSVGVKSHV
ncbi:hypothetical protein CONLIGDRAFT_648953 [Coniochaeta ligniaria NRRL 30616]|uniref:Uncharacterized protein n=1 Tax=Coniochaeta ligniaria NRRL 30616 TaxID=1408157 RepID=A0A1J7J2W0_9PEZI|nr:hypothetical protein CONLIGDRAFT_648953 [Coniochaeta ligniaria NRRL 30616]